jgi:tryptophanyl-tRNA synthetase
MRPTGKLHLGNYMGALHNWVRLQHEYECFFFIADWHALTTDYANPTDIPDNINSMALDWLSAGLDPEKCTMFVQSRVDQHANLHLALSMITPLSWLERVPSYKDQQLNLSEKDLSTYGFLGYPLLQSADILLYGVPGGSLHVPVGADQVAHVELTREVARRFNFLYPENRADLLPARTLSQSQLIAREGTGIAGLMSPKGTGIVERDVQLWEIADGTPSIGHTLLEPQVLLTPTPKLPGTDGRKMSKSYGNFILLSDPEPEIRKKLKTMVTDPARVRRSDPGDPDKCPVGDLHKVFSSPETMTKVYDGCRTAGIGCIECKGWLADAVVAELAPMQERRSMYEQKPALVEEILEAGSERARHAAEQTMAHVRRAMGIKRRINTTGLEQ